MAFTTGFWSSDPSPTQGTAENMNMCLMGYGPKSDFPAAAESNKGFHAFATDEGIMYYSNGSSWEMCAPPIIGTDGQEMAMVSGVPAFRDDIVDIVCMINGGGIEITTGIQGATMVDFACEIMQATLLADQNGAIVIDIWKDTYANFPPTDADSITASAPPTISASGRKAQDATLTGWTKTISAGDILFYNVDSCTSITWCLIVLKVKKL